MVVNSTSYGGGSHLSEGGRNWGRGGGTNFAQRAAFFGFWRLFQAQKFKFMPETSKLIEMVFPSIPCKTGTTKFERITAIS